MENSPVVLLDVVQVITADGDGAVHLHLLDDTSQDAATNWDIASEWALLVNVGTINGLWTRAKNGLFQEKEITNIIPSTSI